VTRSILVTGGAGFIGSNFCHYWLEQYSDDSLLVLDKLTYAGSLDKLKGCEQNPNYHFVQGDICDQSLLSSLFQKHAFDTVIHFAAESHVDRSIADPDAFMETNIIGTYTLLKVAKQFWLDGGPQISHRFHHISTDEVYGSLSCDDLAFTENTAYAPNSPYAASKASSDHLVRAYANTYGLRVTVSNCSNNYGPRQDAEKLIPLIIQNVLEGKSIPVYGDGKNVRDWLYVQDHCRAIDCILQKGKEGEVYNIGGENEWHNIDIVTTLCERIDKILKNNPTLAKQFPKALHHDGNPSTNLITYVEDRAGHDRRYAVDPEKCHRELGFHPVESFESGIDLTIEWYLNEFKKSVEI
jgi:dTDP-glucose 4,6-dehydratase